MASGGVWNESDEQPTCDQPTLNTALTLVFCCCLLFRSFQCFVFLLKLFCKPIAEKVGLSLAKNHIQWKNNEHYDWKLFVLNFPVQKDKCLLLNIFVFTLGVVTGNSRRPPSRNTAHESEVGLAGQPAPLTEAANQPFNKHIPTTKPPSILFHPPTHLRERAKTRNAQDLKLIENIAVPKSKPSSAYFKIVWQNSSSELDGGRM